MVGFASQLNLELLDELERIVHEYVASFDSSIYMTSRDRHESLPRGWIRKIPEFKLKSRQNIIVQLRLGDHTANVIGLLGVGSFAAVFSCSFPGDEQLVAVKLERQVRICYPPCSGRYPKLPIHQNYLGLWFYSARNLNNRCVHYDGDLNNWLHESEIW